MDIISIKTFTHPVLEHPDKQQPDYSSAVHWRHSTFLRIKKLRSTTSVGFRLKNKHTLVTLQTLHTEKTGRR